MKRFDFSMLTLAALLMVTSPAPRAAESSVGVPMPGLQSDPPNTVVPQDCTVNVTDGQVSVDISVSTLEEKPALLFEGPRFGWSGPSEPYADQHFPELKFRIDGESSAPEDYFRAFLGSRDISALLKMAGMDPWAIARTPALTAAHARHSQVLKVLTDMGAVEKSGDGFLAKWQAQRVLRIPLKSVQAQHVQYDYTARPATSTIAAEQLDTAAREKIYCMSPAQLRGLIHRGADARSVALSEFNLPTGIDGTPPKSVTLTISAGPARDVGSRAYWFLCGPHGKSLSRQGSITRERADVDESGSLHVLRVLE